MLYQNFSESKVFNLIPGAKHLELKLEHAQNQMMQQDRIVRGVEEKEKDLNEALKAKDSQLAVLRVRMQEADDELNSKTELLRNLTAENERYGIWLSP